MARRGSTNIEVVGMAGEQYDRGTDGDGFLKGGYNSQLPDDPPWNYIGTSQITEYLIKYVNSYRRSIGRFERSVVDRTSCRGISTRRDPITFETGDERK